MSTESLCQNCFCCDCDWHEHFKPVDGWEATPTIIREQRRKGKVAEIPSYCVHKCPLYKDRGRGIIPVTREELQRIVKMHDLRTPSQFIQCEKKLERIGYVIYRGAGTSDSKRKSFYLMPIGDKQ